jgi:signal transduction histidine kinase
MQSSNSEQVEAVLRDLAHDLRQSLGTIEVSAYVLNRSLPEADARTREHLRSIERQVERASDLLRDAVAEMRRLRAQSTGEANLALTKSATA